LASYYGNVDVLRFLITEAGKLNYNFDIEDRQGFTPLLSACFHGYDYDEEDAVT